jgi:hypothetical protein
MSIKSYLEGKLLNSDTSVKWPKEESEAFEGAKEGLLLLSNYLENKKLIAGNNFTYKTGAAGELKEAVVFTLFCEAFSCYVSSIHIAWNGQTTAATMLIRRIYELLVNLSFMLHKYTKRRLNQFVAMADVSRYMRLIYLYPDSKPKDTIKDLKNRLGKDYDSLYKNYLKYRRKFELRKKDKQSGKIQYVYTGDWSFGLINKNKYTSIKQKANTVGLGNLHYKLNYGIFSSKSHPDAWYIGCKANISDSFLNKITFPIFPDKENSFKPEIMCGTQYIVAFFIIFARIFNLYTLAQDEDLLSRVKLIKDHQDFRELFKKVKIPFSSDF